MPKPAALATPAAVVQACARDVRTLDPHIALTTRYLSFHFLQGKEDLRFAFRILNYQLGLLNRRPTLPRMQEVPGTLGTLFRVDLRQLALKKKDLERLLDVWEKLANTEPVYHYNVRFVTYDGIRQTQPVLRGQVSLRRKRRKVIRKVKTVPVLADWLSDDPKDANAIKDVLLYNHSSWRSRYERASQQVRAIESLVFRTGSAVPVVDGSWFFQQTAIAADRDADNPGYDEFLGIKTQDDYEQLVGFNKKQTDDFTRSLFEATADSGVKKDGVRRIEIRQKAGGEYYLTFDAIKAKDRFNPLRVVNGSLKFNATEAFAHKADGLWAMGLFDNKRQSQRSAPDFVGGDTTSTSHDTRIEKPLSCLRCHVNGGLRDIKRPYFRRLFNTSPEEFVRIMKRNLPVLALGSPDPDELAILQDQYLRPLETAFEDSRRRYERAVFEVTDGWDGKTLSKRYATAYREWYDSPITLEGAALRVGVSPGRFQKALSRVLKDSGTVDSVLSAYLRPDEDKMVLPFDAFWEAYPLAQFALRGKSPLDFVQPDDDKVIRRKR